MAKCSNCEKAIEGDNNALTVCGNPRGAVIADLCAQCTNGVLVMKLVFKREKPSDDFAFEQYLPVESSKT